MKRRDFIRYLTVGSGAGIVSGVLAVPTGSHAIEQEKSNQLVEQGSIYGRFTHGVASGDPLNDRMIIWTRFVPESPVLDNVFVTWEMAEDDEFTKECQTGVVQASFLKDFIVKVDVANLQANKRYYYRFKVGSLVSSIGVTKTLPAHNVEKVRMAVATCANYPTGYFNVYKEISVQHEEEPFDVLVHIGDYIYEYGMGEYATEHAIELDRVPVPAYECVSLQDYRRRYAQYRTDPDLQALHEQLPFIHTWDDHEIADNSWQQGALNHQFNEGEFSERRKAAVQAFMEWLPIRDDMAASGEIYRDFKCGDLVHLVMLDTRVTGRTKQLDYSSYSKKDPQAAYDQLQKDLYAKDHRLLGDKQQAWLDKTLRNKNARWTALGQQVLMTKMELPFNLLLALMGAKKARRTRTPFDSNLIMEAARNPSILKSPYNLDAWDGYPRDRDWLYEKMEKYSKSFVSFAGDTHNAWAGELTDKNNNACGVEFATASVTSPGIDYYVPLPPFLMRELQKLFPSLITDLKWANIVDRGFMAVTFTEDDVKCDWVFVNKILSKDYKTLPITSATTEDARELDIDLPDNDDWQYDEDSLEDLEDFLEKKEG